MRARLVPPVGAGGCAGAPMGIRAPGRMCLGIPGRIEAVGDEHGLKMGSVAFGGVRRSVCLEYVADAVVGDWVLVHVGFALSRIDEAEAMRIFELLEEMGQLEELEP